MGAAGSCLLEGAGLVACAGAGFGWVLSRAGSAYGGGRLAHQNGSIIYIRDDKGILKSALPAPQLKVARDAAKLVARLGRQLGL